VNPIERLLSLKPFKVDASRCNVRVGDDVAPGTTVGTSFASGEPLRPRCSGVVEDIKRCSDDHALFFWVRLS
jgi:hypothetical protein